MGKLGPSRGNTGIPYAFMGTLMSSLNQVGDFGYVDRDTGVFQVEGNIYSDMFAQYIPGVKMKDHPPVDAAIEEMRVITTSEVKQAGFNLNPEMYVNT